MAAHSFFDDIQALSTRCTARIAHSVCRRKACPPDALLGLKTLYNDDPADFKVIDNEDFHVPDTFVARLAPVGTSCLIAIPLYLVQQSSTYWQAAMNGKLLLQAAH
eukprot:12778-Heterococcus_DN1.PRE.3